MHLIQYCPTFNAAKYNSLVTAAYMQIQIVFGIVLQHVPYFGSTIDGFHRVVQGNVARKWSLYRLLYVFLMSRT